MATMSASLQAMTSQDLETMTMSYIAQGFNVANKTPMQVTLIKRKQFSYLWAVIGFFFCLLPLFIYIIVYLLESDQMVTITVTGAPPMTATGPLGGSQPLIASGAPGMGPQSAYLNAPRSPDGFYWWDGQSWQLIPQAGQAGAPGQPQTGPFPGQPPQTGPMYQEPPSGPSYQDPSTGPMYQDPPTGPSSY